MKKIVLFIALGLITLLITACKSSTKEAEMLTATTAPANTDDLVKNVYTDNSGEKIEVTINNTQNTAIVHLDGKTYELKKSAGLPEYTASDAEYQYSNIRGKIIFLKKNYDMVLFTCKENDKEQSATKMASY